MRILLVGAYPPPHGGVEVHMAHLHRYLQGRGHDCFVINLGRNKNLNSANMISPKYAIQVAYHLWKRRDRICHLHFGGLLHPRLQLLALFSAIVFKGRCTVTIHSGGLPTWGTPSDLKRKLIGMCFSRCASLICVNQQIAEYFIILGIDRARVFVISPFAFPEEGMDGLPAGFASFIRNRNPVICSIGGLEPEYNLDFMLKVFRKYKENERRAGLILIGAGSMEGDLKGLAARLGLAEDVVFTGDLAHQHTLRLLSESNIFVRPSQYDGDCISLREALHLGIPAIASDTGMRPKGTRLFPIGNETQLLEAMQTALADPLKKRTKVIRQETAALSMVERIYRKVCRT